MTGLPRRETLSFGNLHLLALPAYWDASPPAPAALRPALLQSSGEVQTVVAAAFWQLVPALPLVRNSSDITRHLPYHEIPALCRLRRYAKHDSDSLLKTRP